nr:immunoglobulin light chain junction region [Macaca mulatta]
DYYCQVWVSSSDLWVF